MRRLTLSLSILTLLLPASGCFWLPSGSLDEGSTEGGRGTSAGATEAASSSEESAYAPHLENLRTCLKPEDSKCPQGEDIFAPEDRSISMTAEITNVSPGLQAEIIWSYLGGGDGSVAPFEVARDVVVADTPQALRPVVTTIEKKDPGDYWASGEYKVEIRLNEGRQTLWKTFRVK